MLVFAFDRDWTVDVNPHPEHEAVPLQWVRHLAHESPHAVYAIGNQELADEAGIPGVVDVVGRHPDDWDEWLGEIRPDGYYERYPERRERLALVADLHPDADGYVVVDDIDLSDVGGWDHYHAWEFVPAVEAGEVDPDLPWANDPVPDGGLPTRAGIVPPGPTALSSFLDEYADAPGFELTYTTDDTERTVLLHDVSVESPGDSDQSATPRLQCRPIPPDEPEFAVGIDTIDLLSVVELPADHYTSDAETPAETAAGLRRLAETNPEAVGVSSVLTLLDSADADPDRDRDALRALRLVAEQRPDDCRPAIPILRSLLAREDPPGVTDLLATLRAVGQADPGAIAPLSDEMRGALAEAEGAARREAVRCLAAVADDHPEDLLAAVPSLATVLDDRADGAEHAVHALSEIAEEEPSAVEPVAETLSSAALDDALSDVARLNASAGMGRIVSVEPSVGVDLVPELTVLFEAENEKLRNNAVALIYEVARIHTDVVASHTAAIAPLLTVDDDYTRINASGALSRVAEDYPETVAELTPTFVELLGDDDAAVRENACWALGYLAAEAAKPQLSERAREDEDGEVRTRASWALDRIEAS